MKIWQKASVANLSEQSSVIDRLNRPDYTGENRCIPCTLVNVFLAAGISAGVAGIVRLAGGRVLVAALLAGGSLLLSLSWIYLRGYLVPYTPTLTKRYFPDRVLRWFEKYPNNQPIKEAENFDVESFLLEARLLTECDDRDDWCLEPSFEKRWKAKMNRIDTHETHRATIAELLDADPDQLRLHDHGSATTVKVDGQTVGQWESDAALIADIAADSVLAETHDEWESYQLMIRSQVLNSLRMFLENCPSCDAPISMGQETVESCCRTFDVIAVTCQDCGARVFELEAEQIAQ